MRLYLAVAVLMLAFVAYTEATQTVSPDQDTFLDELSNIGQKIVEKGNEAMAATGNWFRDRFSELGALFQ